jgi:predicted esterase
LLRYYAWWRINLAQQEDVEDALATVRGLLNTQRHARLVIQGTSRGAAVALQVAPRVPLLVLEAPFTTVEDVIEARFAWPLRWVVRAVLRTCTRYRAARNATWSPLAAAREFRHPKMPIVLVSSHADTIVPMDLTTRLAAALRTSGVAHVHEIKLSQSSHSSFSSEVDADRVDYVRELDALYGHYVY